MPSFEEAERRANLAAAIPKSVNDGKIVKLKAKELKTTKEVRTILPEEKYVKNLEKIIVRDYYPELPKLQAQAEYMDAMARNDLAKMRELQLRYATSRRTDRRTSPIGGRLRTSPTCRATSPSVFDPETPGPSKRGDETPAWNEEGDNERDKKKQKKGELESMTVDQYLNKFTSEDNASFEELTDLMVKRERAKNAWIYEAAEKHNQEMITLGPDHVKEADVQLALRYDVEKDKEKPHLLDNWAYTARNTVLFHPEGAEFTPEEKVQMAARNQRVINKTATRFPDDLKNRPSESSMARAAFMQAQNHAGKVDVTGKEAGISNATLGLVATPSPMPGVDDSPLMTWGEIDGTPFRLDGADIQPTIASGPVFKIPEIPVREQIAQSISDTMAKRYAEKRRYAMEQAEKAHKTPRFGSSRSSGKKVAVSPAARLLMENKLGIRLGSDKLKKTGRTPTPGSVRTPGSSSRTISSSIRRKGAKTPVNYAQKASITDGLLKLKSSREMRSSPGVEEVSSPTRDSSTSESNDSTSTTVPSSGTQNRPKAGDFF